MNPEEIIKIKRLLKEKNLEYLYCNQLNMRSYKEVVSILSLPYWEKTDAQGNLIYKKLLTSSIWALNTKKIEETIEILEEYGLGKYITISIMRKAKKQIIALIEYLIENKLPVIINEKLNPIFNVSPSVLKRKYNLDIKELEKKYGRSSNLKLCLSY